LLCSSLGEANAEQSQKVAINSLGLHKGFNKGVPLLDEGAQLVLSDIHSVEVGEAVVTLDFFHLDLYLSPGLSSAVSVQISQRYFEYTSLQTIGRVLLPSSFVARGDGWDSHIENGRDMYVVPFFS